MKFISLFSGIGGFDLGFERAGMECVAQVEFNTEASKVLAHHFPTVPRFGDVRDVGRHNLPPAELICGGFPCQDVSVAGRRAGLAGGRSGLWFEFLRILAELKPEWAVIENVPGLLSSNDGRDFALILHGLVECGYRVAWRVLDAQYFGVAQRRRRVFIVGYLGDGRAAEILFERESGTGHPQPGGAARERTAGTVSASAPSRRNGGSDPTDGHFIYAEQRSDQFADASVASTLASRDAKGVRTMVSVDLQQVTLKENRSKLTVETPPVTPQSRIVIAEVIDVRNNRSNGDISGALQAKENGSYSLNYQNPIAIHAGNGDDISPALSSEGADGSEDGRGRHAFVAFNPKASASTQQPVRKHGKTGTLAVGHPEGVFGHTGVRRLTPTECERLQGFPDGWTAEQSDSQRYRQLGNAVCVNVAEWLGHRLMAQNGF